MPPNRSALFIAGLDLPQIGTWRNKNGQIINTAQFGISIPEQYPYQQIGVGYNHPDFFLKTPPESWDALIAVNLVAVMACVRAALPAMVEQGHGAIVSTASTAAFGEPRQGVYAAAKAGVVAFIRTIALEYGRHGVRANLVAPGLTLPDDDAAVGDQSLWRDRHSVMSDAQVDYVVKNTPLRRLPKSADIANAVTFLASDTAARLITGQLITVAGGFAMR